MNETEGVKQHTISLLGYALERKLLKVEYEIIVRQIEGLFHAGKIAALSALEKEMPSEEEMVADNLRFGDTDYHSNSVRFGRNDFREQLLTLIKRLRK